MEKTLSRNEEFAVIGIAARMPEANHVDEFWQNLIAGKDSVRPLPLSRIKLLPDFDPAKEYPINGYIEGIDEFDPVFFKIAPNSAAAIDPAHRLLLEMVNNAIEDAGYCREQLRGKKVGVFLGSYYPEYYKYVDQGGMDALVGNLPANFAGRIAYLNGFTGPALTIDTACSSTLVAVHTALQSLKNDDCEVAVIGGANVRIELKEKTMDQMGITSPTGKCRSFSSQADGVGGGEGVIAVLVKPLEKALADHDQIYAVIKSSTANQDGDRSNGMTAPSPDAQKEAIQTAWRKAGIDPRTISYIECHGSATKLGDPIEIAGITKAFRSFTDEKQFCPIGAVKSNIGHLDSVAGLAGFLKTVLALRFRKIPPTVHFTAPNPYIDFANSPVYVAKELLDWKSSEGAPRRAGVSSFGISGTNCHVVLEEAPVLDKPTNVRGKRLFTVAGSDEKMLKYRVSDLLRYLDSHTEANLADVSFTLNCGRQHFTEYRLAVVAETVEELKSKLMSTAPVRLSKMFKESTLFLLPDYEPGAEKWLDLYREAGFKNSAIIDECNTIVNLRENPKAAFFAFEYALAQMWQSVGIRPQSTIGIGVGEAVSAVLTKRLTLEEGLAKALKAEPAELKVDKLQQFIESQLSKGRNLFLNLAPGKLGEVIQPMLSGRENVYYYESFGSPESCLETLAALYLQGVTLEWSELFTGWRISLPTSPYNKKSYWFSVDHSKLHHALEQAAPAQMAVPEIEIPAFDPEEMHTPEQIAEVLTAIWKQRLGLEEVSQDVDFIEVGGDSLRAMMLMADIHKYFQVELDIAYLLEYGTIEMLARLIHERREASGSAAAASETAESGADIELSGLSADELEQLNAEFGSLLEGIEK